MHGHLNVKQIISTDEPLDGIWNTKVVGEGLTTWRSRNFFLCHLPKQTLGHEAS